jgi:hypothetical protein
VTLEDAHAIDLQFMTFATGRSSMLMNLTMRVFHQFDDAVSDREHENKTPTTIRVPTIQQ